MSDQPDPTSEEPQIVIVRDGRGQPVPRYMVWLLLLIAGSFALGIWLASTGLLAPDPDDAPRPPDYAETIAAP